MKINRDNLEACLDIIIPILRADQKRASYMYDHSEEPARHQWALARSRLTWQLDILEDADNVLCERLNQPMERWGELVDEEAYEEDEMVLINATNLANKFLELLPKGFQ